MSRHEFNKDLIADDGTTNHYQIVVGWDVGIQTYFGLVYNLDEPNEDLQLIVDMPNPMMPGNEITDPQDLLTRMDGFGQYAIERGLVDILTKDRELAEPQSPMQKAGLKLAEKLMFDGMFGLPDD